MLKQCCDRLTWYDLNIVSTLPENFFSTCCKNLATAWLDIVLTQSTNDANAVFVYSRKACYPSLAERITESCKVVLPFEHVDEMPWCYHSNETFLAVLSRGTICFPSRAIFVWPWNENAQTKQKQQTNGNRALWLVCRTDTNARGFWLVKRTLGWKNFMAENFLEINGYFALTSYCNTIGQSNNAFSILGFSLGGKRRGRVLIFSPIGW